MSRSIIWGIVAVVIAALTATAYFGTAASQEKRVKKELRDRVEAARNQMGQIASIPGLQALDRVDKLANNPRLLAALAAPDYADLKREAGIAWSEFLVDNKETAEVDFALVDASGNVVYVNAPPGETEPPFPTAGQFKDAQDKLILPALEQALTRRIAIAEIGTLPGATLSRIVVASIVDYDATAKAAASTGVAIEQIAGAVVVSFPFTHDVALSQDLLLRARVGYFDAQSVATTSFQRADNKENTDKRDQVAKALDAAKLRADTFDPAKKDLSPLTDLEIGGESYVGATIRLGRLATKDVERLRPSECEAAVDLAISLARASAATDPNAKVALDDLVANRGRRALECEQKATWDDWRCMRAAKTFADLGTCPMPGTSKWSYPPQHAGAFVVVATGSEAEAFSRPARTFILLLGLGALVVALFGMYLSHHRLETQIDQIELGVTEIINGNLDKTFQPVGKELDGLANGLNVMLARLLGRPEPGEEAFDENGNPIVPGRVDFEEAPEGPAPAQATDDLEALAREPEPDYYKRLYTEYGRARRDTGSPDDVSFESFIAKLRVNEGKLKAQYQCRAVRFRVVVKDGKVSLKPVPIF